MEDMQENEKRKLLESEGKGYRNGKNYVISELKKKITTESSGFNIMAYMFLLEYGIPSIEDITLLETSTKDGEIDRVLYCDNYLQEFVATRTTYGHINIERVG